MMTCVSNYFSIANQRRGSCSLDVAMLHEKIKKKSRLSAFWKAEKLTYHDKMLGTVLLVNFCLATGLPLTTPFPDILGRFGILRIMQFFGCDNSDTDASNNLSGHLEAVLHPHIQECIKQIGSPPKTVSEFITAVALHGHDKQDTPEKFPWKVRIGNAGLETILRETNESNAEMQKDKSYVPFSGSLDNLSKTGKAQFLWSVLMKDVGDSGTEVPAGARETNEPGKSGDDVISRDCVKKSLCLAAIDDEEKICLNASLPDTEMDIRVIQDILRKEVKTIQIGRKLVGDLKALVLNSNEPMLAIHCPSGGSGENHCVYIDGERGLIWDPVDEGHGESLSISPETFSKLRIGRIDALYKIQRCRLNKNKKRKRMQECVRCVEM